MTPDQKKLVRAWVLLTATSYGRNTTPNGNDTPPDTVATQLGFPPAHALHGKMVVLITWMRDTLSQDVPQTYSDFFATAATTFKNSFNSDRSDPWPPDGNEHPGYAEMGTTLQIP